MASYTSVCSITAQEYVPKWKGKRFAVVHSPNNSIWTTQLCTSTISNANTAKLGIWNLAIIPWGVQSCGILSEDRSLSPFGSFLSLSLSLSLAHVIGQYFYASLTRNFSSP